MLIRRLSSHADYRAAEDLQRKVWNYPDREIIPLSELVTVQRNGGHVFAAFEGRRMAGFCWGLPGYRDGRPYHCSRMLGVLPRHRDGGLGTALKLKQREFCLEQGLELVRWTFDPLQSRNAYFNIEKLGGIVREYCVNLYGESGSRFSAGLETDRLAPEWWITSRRVRDHLARRHPPTRFEEASSLPGLGRGGRFATILIPTLIDDLKRRDLKAARKWRFDVRRQFLLAFRRGYVVTGFAQGLELGAYVLQKGYRVR